MTDREKIKELEKRVADLERQHKEMQESIRRVSLTAANAAHRSYE